MQLVSIDTWSTILSYLKNTDIEPANTDQLVAIIKMSFVNKSLRDLIASNHFWILYNSIEYESAKYNIYEWNCNFCRILSKIKSLKTIKDMNETKNFISLTDHIFIHLLYLGDWYNFNIRNKASIFDSMVYIDSAIFNRSYACCENEYCVLFQTFVNDYCNLTFYMKKQSLVLYKLKEFADFCDLYNNNDLLKNISQFKYFENRTDIINFSGNIIMLHDNYIWSTEISMYFNTNYIIKFYAYNVMTNIKYLVNEIEIIRSPSNYLECYFSK